jgi:hypothetical protein
MESTGPIELMSAARATPSYPRAGEVWVRPLEARRR